MKKIYIAGPDVFRLDAERIGKVYKEICESYGFKGLFPLDNELYDPFEIFNSNIEMIKECNFVVANLELFRGDEMDSGTAFEVGFAKALDKTVIGYSTYNREMIERVECKYSNIYDKHIDENGLIVEDFNYANNLMIQLGCNAIIDGSFEDAIEYLAINYGVN